MRGKKRKEYKRRGNKRTEERIGSERKCQLVFLTLQGCLVLLLILSLVWFSLSSSAL